MFVVRTLHGKYAWLSEEIKWGPGPSHLEHWSIGTVSLTAMPQQTTSKLKFNALDRKLLYKHLDLKWSAIDGIGKS